jgi:hypothetical protein
MDANYLAGQIARECLSWGVQFEISATRNHAIWRAATTVADHA